MSSPSQPSPISQPSSSTPVASRAKDSRLRGPGGKLLVTVTPLGCVTGPNAATYHTRSSEVVRSCVPLSYTDWRTVDSTFKDDIWTTLMGEFEFNVDPMVARPLLEVEFPQRFRTGKYYFRTKILDKCERFQEKLRMCPDGVDPGHWKTFVLKENSPAFEGKRKKNAANRSKYKTTHTNGRRTYAQRFFIETAKNPGIKLRRVDMWFKGKEHPDGTVLESSKEVYDQVKAADEKLKECSTELDMSSPSIEIASDALQQVFGPEKKNRTRAIGSNISKKRLQQASLAKAVLAGSGSEIAEVQANMAEVNVKIDKFEGSMNNLQSNFGTLQELLVKLLTQQGNQAPPSTQTNITEIGSTSLDRPGIIKQNVNRTSKVTPECPMSNVHPKVEILNKEGVVVATGYVVTDEGHAGICHGKKVGLGEKKVYVENVLIPDSPIYDAPQGGSSVMEDVVEGGFLIWLECRLKY